MGEERNNANKENKILKSLLFQNKTKKELKTE